VGARRLGLNKRGAARLMWLLAAALAPIGVLGLQGEPPRDSVLYGSRVSLAWLARASWLSAS
jgi:hypothetical protein